MDKVELFRASKAPVDLEAYAGYQDEWVKFYDAVLAKYGQDMEHVHILLEKGEKRLNRKYNKKVLIDWPQSTSEVMELCDKYKCPVMFAQRADGNGIVAVIMDEL